MLGGPKKSSSASAITILDLFSKQCSMYKRFVVLKFPVLPGGRYSQEMTVSLFEKDITCILLRWGHASTSCYTGEI